MSSEKITQARVGIFVLIGLIAICVMVVYFGRFGDGLKKYYNLRVEYPNASGLFAGADVLLAGAKVGSVKEGPYVLDNMRGVYVILQIEDGVQVPQGSSFTIGSSGLLGDSYVNINMPADLDVEKYVPIAPGTTVIGQKESGGLSSLAGEGSALLDDVKTAVKNIDTVVKRINEEVLNKKSVEAINESLKNLKTTSEELAEASKNLDSVISNAAVAVTEATETVKKVGQTAEKSNETLEAATGAAKSFDRTMVEVRSLVQEAKSGRGPLGTLISDRTMADNLRALVVNLRRHGILWYKDRSGLDRQREEE